MALMICPDCGRQVSDRTASCPGCGHLIKRSIRPGDGEFRLVRGTSPFAWAFLMLLLVAAYALLTAQSFRDGGLPPLPVNVATRQALLGNGRVLQVRNTSDRQLSIQATLANPATREQRTFHLDLPPGGASEIALLQGRARSSDDTITLSSVAFQTWSGSAP